MERRTVVSTLLFAVVLVVSVGAGFTAPAAGGHGAEYGNYTVNLPHPSDHYPRGVNGYNASINHFAAGTPELYENAGASEGVEKLGWIVIQNQDVDFSQCSSTNTAAYGIDRGNDDAGTYTDVDLLNYMEASYFNDHSIKVDHYEGDEIAAPDDAPVEVYPEDEIVAHQGHQSQGGACYGMPEEPGWYQIEGFANGTAFNGNHVKIELTSHYFYICECDSEQEARNKIGPPPSEQGDGGDDPTPTPTPAPDSNDGGDDPTPTPTAASDQSGGGGDGDDGDDGGAEQSNGGDDGGSQQADDSGGQATASPTPARSGGGDDQARAAAQPTEAVPTTPTIASGPGFGAALSFFALVAAALVALRRR